MKTSEQTARPLDKCPLDEGEQSGVVLKPNTNAAFQGTNLICMSTAWRWRNWGCFAVTFPKYICIHTYTVYTHIFTSFFIFLLHKDWAKAFQQKQILPILRHGSGGLMICMCYPILYKNGPK